MKCHIKLQQEKYSPFPKKLVSLLLISASLFLFSDSRAQPDYARDAVWIKMMDDTTVNYYEALKAYNEYWKTHMKPAGEEEEMAEGDKDSKEREREIKREIRKDRKKIVTEEDLKRLNENEVMKYHVKRFEQWRREMKPFVQEDGRILTDHERLQIWNKQQEEIKQQQK